MADATGELVTDKPSEVGPERPVHGYAGEHGRPLLADMLEIGGMYKHLGLGDDVQLIDNYILAEITARDLKPNHSSYSSVYEELTGKLGFNHNQNTETVVQGTATLVEVLQRIKGKERLGEMIGLNV